MIPVAVIGMGLSIQDLTAAHLALIQGADILVGGRRLLAAFDHLTMEKRVIGADIDAIIAFIRTHMGNRRIVVLASGDPLFYGIGVRLSSELGADQVTIYPNISSIAAAFARIREPWATANIVSLHGRDQTGALLAALRTDRLTAVLTDHTHTPAWLATWLQEKGVLAVQLAIFERLGSPEERFGWYTPEQAAALTSAEPNLVILKPCQGNHGTIAPWLGMDDSLFDHERGLITKAEVRAVTLAKLRLMPGQTLWDLGAGSGAVGIEASLLLGPGRVVAVEQKNERVANIYANARKMGVYNLDAYHLTLPDGLERLPAPDRVFIGGGGRSLATIISTAARLLKSDGRMVVNTVLFANFQAALDAFTTAGFDTEVVQLQVNRSKPMPWSARFEAQNPVWIITATKAITDDRS